MRILVVNCGSSSLKYQLLDMDGERIMARGLMERIGESNGRVFHRTHMASGRIHEVKFETPLTDHRAALRQAVRQLTASDTGAIAGPEEIDAVGHRVVHGGEAFREPTLVDAAVLDAIEKTIPLAPLHNPANLMVINIARELFPQIPQVVVFDTAFHHTLPPHARHYALPWSYYEELGVRRYGFHGVSHQYVSREAARRLGRSPEDANLITAHLGNGASICAIKEGASVNTSMGMTPLQGLVMGTRGGDIDPGVMLYLARCLDMSVDELEDVLQNESGLKGLCGMNDMRDIQKAAESGDASARLALDMFVHRCRHYIGAYAFELGRLDALIFTAGIGENDAVIRAACCEGLASFGLNLDPLKNRTPEDHQGEISSTGSPIKIYVIPTNEGLEIARQTAKVVGSIG
ncbi:acetate kinase [uncultured Desulfosarcina sp.]|uniref:acetate/propionate family kinase n=1 Tax=uncultured Desulfosarcina sp. TaxID=218289 RepID=UPI0029C8E062|nr:acetate kinase [uncultured Desulfosarcina sp.]